MNKVATQRQSRPLLTDLASMLDSLPTFAALRPLFDTRAIRVEDEMHDDVYQVRAELPGVDPDEDIEVVEIVAIEEDDLDVQHDDGDNAAKDAADQLVSTEQD